MPFGSIDDIERYSETRDKVRDFDDSRLNRILKKYESKPVYRFFNEKRVGRLLGKILSYIVPIEPPEISAVRDELEERLKN